MVSLMPTRFVNNLQWQYISFLATAVLAFLYSILVGRSLGAADFGAIAVVIGFATVVFQVVELRLQEAVIRYLAEFWEAGDHRRTVATVKLFLLLDAATGVLAFVVVVALSPFAEAHLLRDGRAAHLMILAGAAVFVSNVTTATALGLYRIFGRFKRQAIISTIGSLIKLGLTVVALRGFRCGVIGVLEIAVAVTFFTNAVLTGAAISDLFNRITISPSDAPVSLLREHRPAMIRFIRTTYLLSLTMIPTKELDINILAASAPLRVVGIYRVAKNFVVALWMLIDPASLVIYPELARMWVKRQTREMSHFVKVIAAGFGLGALGTYLLSCFAVPFLVRALLGSDYAAAGALYPWIAWGILIGGPLIWLNPFLLAADRPDIPLKASLFGGVLTALFYFIAVPRFGATGAAFVYSLANVMVLGASISLAFRAGLLPLRVANNRSEA